ncbi:MAG: hypothetical protein R2716_03785 [Microthrixaceae bacterium]
MTLFGDDLGVPEAAAGQHREPGDVVVRVLPDVPALDRDLDYLMPRRLLTRAAEVGSVVRVPLHGRRVRGWIRAVGVEPPAGVHLERVTRLTGRALDAETLELAEWIAWRWVGRLASLLAAATPDRVVPAASRTPARPANPAAVPVRSRAWFEAARELLAAGPGASLMEVSPTDDVSAVALAAASSGQTLVVTPSVEQAVRVQTYLGRAGATVTRWPGGTAAALAGHSVVGGRGAVLAPMPQLAAVVILDEHDPRLQNESSPTWHAREAALERAARRGVPAIMVSPMPSLEARDAVRAPGRSHRVPSSVRRSGWARIEILDRRDADPREGLYSAAFVSAAAGELERGRIVVCVLNRTGRARLLACGSCGALADCEACGAAVVAPDEEQLVCSRCGVSRPRVCRVCGSQARKVLRPGVTRAREDLASLLRTPVALGRGPTEVHGEKVVMGTGAVLNVGPSALGGRWASCASWTSTRSCSQRYRAAEDSLSQLVRASRLVGDAGGAAGPDPRSPPRGARGSTARRRRPAGRARTPPPRTAGPATRRLDRSSRWGGGPRVDRASRPPRWCDGAGPRDGWWILSCADASVLADAAGAVRRPRGRLRLRVDPLELPR